MSESRNHLPLICHYPSTPKDSKNSSCR